MDQLLSGERLWRSDAPAIAEVLRCAPEELAVVAVEFEGYTVLAA